MQPTKRHGRRGIVSTTRLAPSSSRRRGRPRAAPSTSTTTGKRSIVDGALADAGAELPTTLGGLVAMLWDTAGELHERGHQLEAIGSYLVGADLQRQKKRSQPRDKKRR